MTSRRVDPLNWLDPIVDKNGMPTPAFMRRWQQQFSANQLITGLVKPGDVLANIAALSGVAADTTVTALLDYNFGKVEGEILYRGTTAWQSLAPAGTNKLLFVPGPSADPAWRTPAFGFGFFVGGLLLAGEILGGGQFPAAMTFTTADPLTEVQSEIPAAASAVFNIQTWVAGVRTTVGTITFAAGASVGVLAWTASPYTLPAFTILELHAPASADASLAWVTGTVNGVAA